MALCTCRGTPQTASHPDRPLLLLLGCHPPPPLNLGLSSFGATLSPVVPCTPRSCPRRPTSAPSPDLVKPPSPELRHFQTSVQHLSSRENSQEPQDKAGGCKGALAGKGGRPETRVPQRLPVGHLRTARGPLHGRQFPEAPPRAALSAGFTSRSRCTACRVAGLGREQITTV